MGKPNAIISIDLTKCTPCNGLICVGVCPQGVLEEGSNGKPQTVDAISCTRCGVCLNLCPLKAITLKPKE